MPQKVSTKTASDKDAKGKPSIPREVKKITGKTSKILEEISADITPETAKKINKDFEDSISKIEEAGDILGRDLHTTGKDQSDDKKKVKREMKELRKELKI